MAGTQDHELFNQKGRRELADLLVNLAETIDIAIEGLAGIATDLNQAAEVLKKGPRDGLSMAVIDGSDFETRGPE